MNDLTQARRVFDAGLIASGISVHGVGAEQNVAYAKLAFQRASEWAPDMADAWVGRIKCGDCTDSVWEGLSKCAGITLHRETRRLGLRDGALAATFNTGLYIDYPLLSPADVTAGRAAHLINDKRYGEAAEVLAMSDPTAAGTPTVLNWVGAVLQFVTQRWPDVIESLRGHESWKDNYLRYAAETCAGIACAHLGLFQEAVRRFELLERVEGVSIPQAREDFLFAYGLSLREMGDEPGARQRLEAVYANNPAHQLAEQALKSTKMRITATNAEAISNRTDKWDPLSTPSLEEIAEKEYRARGEKILNEAREQLSKQIGLESVKNQVEKLTSSAILTRIRKEKGLAVNTKSLHLVFSGPPGTGKTTIARVIAKIYCGLGFLRTEKVVEASRGDFVGEHLGSTALKTGARIDSALDGVLFIDEAYTLVQEGLSGGDVFGQEAVDTLLARMENDRGRLVVIIAGYDNDIDRFLASNDGLASRFSRRIRFTSYSPDELVGIAELIASSRDAVLSAGAIDILHKSCAHLYNNSRLDSRNKPRRAIDLAGNGRFVRNVIEGAEEEREFRLSRDYAGDTAKLNSDQLMIVERQDMIASLGTILGDG